MRKLLMCMVAVAAMNAEAGYTDQTSRHTTENDNVGETLSEVKKLAEMHTYVFEFKVLPLIGRNLSPEEEVIELLSDPEYILREMMPQMGYYVDILPADIKVETVDDGLDLVVVWKMPEPEEMPMAGYIAFVPNHESNQYQVFYLEKSINFDGDGPAWVLGTVSESGHSNYGSVKDPKSHKKFVKLIREKTGTQLQ